MNDDPAIEAVITCMVELMVLEQPENRMQHVRNAARDIGIAIFGGMISMEAGFALIYRAAVNHVDLPKEQVAAAVSDWLAAGFDEYLDALKVEEEEL